MIFPLQFEQKTGFNRIRAEISGHCLGDAGAAEAEKMAFSTDFDIVLEKLSACAEMLAVLMSGRNFPAQDYYDLRPVLKRLTIQGTIIELEDLGALRASMRTWQAVYEFFRQAPEGLYPVLCSWILTQPFDPYLLQEADKILDEKGEIKDSASETLLDIRRQRSQKKNLVEKRLRQVYSALKKEGYTPDEADITIRNGRSVIPLPAANKRVIRGFIHDESASGQTVYMEPEEVFEINNELRELEAAERREILKILALYTDKIRPEIPVLDHGYTLLGQIDFTRAKAVFARRIRAVLPKIENRPGLDFRQALNPNLYLKELQQGSRVVPLDIRLNQQERILVISGPNAGGKSVCLKTAGVLQYMLQCGCLIPVREDSEAGIFETIFIEIGDEQSIENDLSTYSSHLRNIRTLTEVADGNTLFLVDEFGSGTEPQMGGAIAEAVLERLASQQAFGIVTTHYMNLKLMAGRVDGIINGAMLYDTHKMQPLYSLLIGKPGSSFAFEIAAKTGLPDDILKAAAEKSGAASFDFEQQLQDLEVERRELEKQRQEFGLADEMLSGLIDRYNDLNAKLDASRRQILDQAKVDAAALLRQSNALVENAIRKIRESEANKEVNAAVREELKEFTAKVIEPFTDEKSRQEPLRPVNVKSKSPRPRKTEKPAPPVPVREGGFVRIIGQNTVYDLEKISGKTATISSGNIRLRIPIDQLESSRNERPPRSERRSGSSFSALTADLEKKISSFKTTIDVRGQRAEEALGTLQKYIDDALLLSIFEVRILHGKGNGVLRNIIHEILAGMKEVKSFHDESLEAGGHGVTVVHFR